MSDANVPFDAGTVPPNHKGYWLNFDGGTLTVYSPDGKVIAEFDAVSGRPGSNASDQDKSWFGPIPEGTYEFDASQLVVGTPPGRASFAGWGNYHVPLNPVGGTETFDRGGFNLHGGVERSSAGCIDVGPQDEEVYNILKDIPGTIYLRVLYDNPNAFNWPESDGWENLWDLPGGVWQSWKRPAAPAENDDADEDEGDDDGGMCTAGDAQGGSPDDEDDEDADNDDDDGGMCTAGDAQGGSPDDEDDEDADDDGGMCTAGDAQGGSPDDEDDYADHDDEDAEADEEDSPAAGPAGP